MHLLIERCRNMGVRVRVPLEGGVLGRDRQTQSLGLSLSLRLALNLDRGHRGLKRGHDLKRLAHKRLRSF